MRGPDNSDRKRKAESEDGTSQSVTSTSTETKTAQAGMSKADRKKQKKEMKMLAKKSQGDSGRPSLLLSRNSNKLSIKDIRDLILYLMTETATLPWVMVKNKFNIKKMVVLYVGGLDPDLFHIDYQDKAANHPMEFGPLTTQGPAQEFQQMKRFFDYMNVIKAGGDRHRVYSPTNTLLNVPLSNTEKIKREAALKKKSTVVELKKPEYYMLKVGELREIEFPIPSYLNADEPLEDGWCETKFVEPASPAVAKKMIAMDCEMCRTIEGSELTRITLVDESGTTIYDELVLPHNPILDYLTQYSGMTAARLEGVTTRLEDVQKKLQELVTFDTILVGHSLENDMKVLKYAHPFIIDTTVIFHHTRGPPFRPSLKWLAHKWLERQIQLGGEAGHDSIEDALTCMDLIKLKLLKEPGFGEYNQESESIFSRLRRHTKSRSSALIDPEAFLNQSVGGESADWVMRPESDEEVVQAVPKALEDYDFVWARLRDMEVYHHRPLAGVDKKAEKVEEGDADSVMSESTGVDDQDEKKDEKSAGKGEEGSEEGSDEGSDGDSSGGSEDEEDDESDEDDEAIREAVRSIDKNVARIIESLGPNTAVVVTSGQGDRREMQKLQKKQKHFQKLYYTKNLSEIPVEEHFLEEDVRALEKAVDKAKNGVCFMFVKT